ncbi:hypothetical protein V6Z11_D10G156400 [Gossypium hirsutum]|uniref:Uncharacterized protein isoform X2 n=1 Tax=Gossypium hirsutum TaxID=3635 RepID=A0A1U8KA00_GOSHI|nr:uncharacterized protein LOC107914797 isoform X2 [Gossypium hirsutum]
MSYCVCLSPCKFKPTINASLSTSTGRNPNFALNLTAWTHVSASTANAIVSKFILTFVILEGFQYSLNTELTGPLDTQPGPHYISKRAALEHMNCGFETVDASRAICNIP